MLCKRCGKNEAEVILDDDDDAYDYYSENCPDCNDALARSYRDKQDWDFWHN